MPDDGSLLLAQINAFFSNPVNNTTIVNEQMFFQIAERIITSNARPALWFYAAGGAVLFVLALMSLISRWPRGELRLTLTIAFPILIDCIQIKIGTNGGGLSAGLSLERLL